MSYFAGQDELSFLSREDLLLLGAAAANREELEVSLENAIDITSLLGSLEKVCTLLELADRPAQQCLQAIRKVSIDLEEALKGCHHDGGRGLLDLLLEGQSAEAVDESRSLMLAMYRDSPSLLWEMVAHDVWAIKAAAQAASKASIVS